jgi:hypothetical protein
VVATAAATATLARAAGIELCSDATGIAQTHQLIITIE